MSLNEKVKQDLRNEIAELEKDRKFIHAELETAQKEIELLKEIKKNDNLAFDGMKDCFVTTRTENQILHLENAALRETLTHICRPPTRECCRKAWQSSNDCDFDNHIFAIADQALSRSSQSYADECEPRKKTK